MPDHAAAATLHADQPAAPDERDDPETEDRIRRREALHGLLASSELTIAPSVMSAAEALGPADDCADAPRALGRLAGYVQRLGTEYMDPDSRPAHVLAGALASWRDLRGHAAAFTGPRAAHYRADALQSAARAAALVAEVVHDLGDTDTARAWYGAGIGDADRAAETARAAGNRHMEGLAVGTSSMVTALYAKKVMPVHPMEAERQAMAAWARLAEHEGVRTTAHAMVPAVISRARAMLGNTVGARSTLAQIEQVVDLPDYPDREPVEMSILRFHRRSYAYTAADVLASCGDVQRARARTREWLTARGPQPVMNAAVLHLGEAACRLADDGPDAAAEYAVDVLTRLPAGHRTPVVLGRAGYLAARMTGTAGPGGRSGGGPRWVRELRELLETERLRACRGT